MPKTIKNIWEKLGRALFWAAWPAIWMIVQSGPPRTRLVLLHKGKILLIKDWLGSGEWTLPGGGLHRREAAEVGAARELLEETSILVDSAKLKSLGHFRTKTNGIPVRITGFFMEEKQLPKVIPRKGELIGFRWADKEELRTLPINATARVVLDAYGSQTGVNL